jgi:hypothetical protein
MDIFKIKSNLSFHRIFLFCIFNTTRPVILQITNTLIINHRESLKSGNRVRKSDYQICLSETRDA